MIKTNRLFILLPVFAILFVAIAPLVSLVIFSVYEISTASGHARFEFVGSEAFRRVFTDPQFVQVTLRNLCYVLIVAFTQLVVGSAIGLWIASLVKSAQKPALLIGLVLIASPIAVSGLWRFLFAFDIGLFNTMIEGIGLDRIAWLSQAPLISNGSGSVSTLSGILSPGLLSAALTEIWLWSPFVAIFVYLRTKALPASVTESAKMDNLVFGQRFWGIILPHLGNILIVLLLIRIIETFRSFDILWSFFGSSKATAVLAIDAYATAQIEGDFSRASVISLVLIVTCFLTLLALSKALRFHQGAKSES